VLKEILKEELKWEAAGLKMTKNTLSRKNIHSLLVFSNQPQATIKTITEVTWKWNSQQSTKFQTDFSCENNPKIFTVLLLLDVFRCIDFSKYLTLPHSS